MWKKELEQRTAGYIAIDPSRVLQAPYFNSLFGFDDCYTGLNPLEGTILVA